MNHTAPVDARHLLPALRTHLWFATCPIELQEALVDLGYARRLQPGQELFARGDTQAALCCVLAGSLRVGAMHPGGERTMLFYLEPYQWFGELSVIDGLGRTHAAVADSDTSIWVVPACALRPWLQSHPQCWQDLGRLATAKLRLMFQVFEDWTRLPITRRLAKYLYQAAIGFDGTSQASPRRVIRLPQAQIAMMMGVRRQTLNKSLRELQASGLVALHYAQIELLDLERLASLVSSP